MLAEGGPSRTLLGRVALPEVRDRFSYHLNRSLAEQLGEGGAPEFRLEVGTRLERDSLAITQDDAITRIRLTAVADWALYRAGTAEPLLGERTVSQSGYNSTASLFATREVSRDVERRLARDLGERIARRLLARAETIAAAAGS
ncbi:MAG TPA: LPS assembly lipoprotein LptE [Thermohalobaculum sp.]|nr:LPS assembly lipoprotein LptE [Thermohalobaculum sp.]